MIDILIKRGKIIDGTGAKVFKADVAVQDGRIAEIADLPEVEAAKVIDAEGKVVCPGLIDIHSHNDLQIYREDYQTFYESFLRQGITTCVSDNCGWSIAPWMRKNSDFLRQTLRGMGVAIERPSWETRSDFHAYLKSRGLPLNFIPLIAHGPVRIAAMGDNARFSKEEELQEMKGLVREGMEAGCRGFSTGLTYFPGMYAHTDEIVELAKVCAGFGGRYVTHVRGYSNTHDLAVKEAIEIAERSGCALQLSHEYDVPYMGRLAGFFYYAVKVIEGVNRLVPLPPLPDPVMKRTLALIDVAMESGMDIGVDYIPHSDATSTAMLLYPPWANIGGPDGLVERLKDPETRRRIKRQVKTLKPKWPHWEEGSWSDNFVGVMGWKIMYISGVGSEKNRGMQGRRIVDLAKETGKDPFEFITDLVVEEGGSVTFSGMTVDQPWTDKFFHRVMRQPLLSFGVDAVLPGRGPSAQFSTYGLFPHLFEHYVKKLRFYPLEEAVHRCTGLSASRFKLDDRGVLRKGAAADILVFDYERIHDNTTLENPQQFPDGIEYVFVNGKLVVEGDEFEPAVLAGQLLSA